MQHKASHNAFKRSVDDSSATSDEKNLFLYKPPRRFSTKLEESESAEEVERHLRSYGFRLESLQTFDDECTLFPHLHQIKASRKRMGAATEDTRDVLVLHYVSSKHLFGGSWNFRALRILLDSPVLLAPQVSRL